MPEAFVAACSDGVEVRCPYGAGQPRVIQFDQDPPIPLEHAAEGLTPTRGLYLVAARQDADGDHWAIVQAQNGPPYAVLIKRRGRAVIKLGIANGQDCVWVTPSGIVAYIEEDGRHWSRNGVSIPCPQTSQGFAYFTDADVPVFRDTIPAIVLDGVRFSRPRLSGHWWVGQGSSPDSVLAYDLRVATVQTVWLGKTPVGPNITQQLDGSAIAGVNPFNTLIRSPFGPGPSPLPPDPPPTLPDDPEDACRFHACFMDGYQHGTPPSRHWLAGTVGWGAPFGDQRLLYGDHTESPTWALVIGTESATEAYIQASLIMASTRRVGVVVYSDAASYTEEALDILDRVKMAGLRRARGIQAYGMASETAEATSDRVEDLVKDAKAAGDRAVLISRADSPYARPLIPGLHKLIHRKFPSTIVGHGVFGCERPQADPVVIDAWSTRWASMPSGILTPL